MTVLAVAEALGDVLADVDRPADSKGFVDVATSASL